MSDKDNKRKTNKVRNDDRKNGKSFKRAGSSRNRKSPQTEVQKVLNGVGLLRNTGPEHPHLLDPWRGVDSVTTPWDREQARENERLYPHLFTGR